MRKNQLLAITAGVFLLFCVGIPLFSLIISLPPDNQLRRVTEIAFWICGFGLLPLLAAAAFVWTMLDLRRGRQSARRLAVPLGLPPLNEESSPLRVWYGGQFKGRSFGMKPVPFGSQSYDGAHNRRSFSVSIYLRVALAVDLARPTGISAARTHRDKEEPESLAAAFPVLENEARLSDAARRALLQFVQQGQRNLRLLDRTAVPPDLLPAAILPDATVILIHDIPRAARIAPEELRAALADLSGVAAALEGEKNE